MNIRMLKHLGVVAALVGSVMSVSVANAAIVNGSQVQMSGTALIDAVGNVVPLDVATGLLFPQPVNVFINSNGNTGSYAGYNLPNPLNATFGISYNATMDNLAVAGPFGGTLLALPAVTIAAPETGPAVMPTFFLINSWTPQVLGSFFVGTALGTIVDGQNNFLANGVYQFSSQNFVAGQVNSFSATLSATVIPVPGAMWIFGSGLLLMTAVMRRKVK